MDRINIETLEAGVHAIVDGARRIGTVNEFKGMHYARTYLGGEGESISPVSAARIAAIKEKPRLVSSNRLVRVTVPWGRLRLVHSRD